MLGEGDLGEDAADVLGNEVVDGSGLVVEGRDGGHDDGAGLLGAEHVFQVDAAEGGVAHAEDKLAGFLEHDVGGAGHEVVAQAAGDGGEGAHGAGDDQHGVHGVAAGGDGGADILIGEGGDLFGGAAEEARGKFFQIAGGEEQFFGEEALSGFSDDEMDAGDARVFVKEGESLLREESAAGSGDADGDDLAFSFGHGYLSGYGKVSLAAVSGASQAGREGRWGGFR